MRDHGLPFRLAHGIAARLVAGSATESLADLLARVSGELVGTPLRYTDEELAAILSPRHFVSVRRTLGGPAPEETQRAAEASRRQLNTDGTWAHRAAQALRDAEKRLAERGASL